MRLAPEQHHDDFDPGEQSLERDPVEYVLVGLGVLVLALAVFVQVLLTSSIAARPAEHTADASNALVAEPVGNTQREARVADAPTNRETTPRRSLRSIDHLAICPDPSSTPGAVAFSFKPLVRELADLPWDQARTAACEVIRLRVLERLDFDRASGPATLLLSRDARAH